jgi:hypothetical protein
MFLFGTVPTARNENLFDFYLVMFYAIGVDSIAAEFQVSAKDKKCIQDSHPLTVLSGNYVRHGIVH